MALKCFKSQKDQCVTKRLKGDFRNIIWMSEVLDEDQVSFRWSITNQKWWDLKAYDVNTLSELSKELKFLVLFNILYFCSSFIFALPNAQLNVVLICLSYSMNHQDEKTRWKNLNKASHAARCILLQEELCMAPKELCMEKVWTMNTMNSLMS